MPSKTISITEDVYETLVQQKRPEESFSDELRRLSQPKGKISECVGLWKNSLTGKEIAAVREAIAEARRLSASAHKEKRAMYDRP